MGGEAPPNEVGEDAEEDSAACGEERRERVESMAGRKKWCRGLQNHPNLLVPPLSVRLKRVGPAVIS
jgi:hypothetical protein